MYNEKRDQKLEQIKKWERLNNIRLRGWRRLLKII